MGTKFRVEPAETDLAGAIGRSLEASLERLGMDRVDLFQLHNLIVREDGAPAPGRGLTARRVLDEVVPALAACGVRARSGSPASPRWATRRGAHGARRRRASTRPRSV